MEATVVSEMAHYLNTQAIKREVPKAILFWNREPQDLAVLRVDDI